uniref:Calpain catalytic domain-containing protein n=1 Tax=Hucho hucho TaxID=62062 RepID=A0A4W5QPT0_9TELE
MKNENRRTPPEQGEGPTSAEVVTMVHRDNPAYNTTMPPPGVCMSIMQERNKKEGVGSLANPEKHSNQDFQQLKQYCLVRGVRYIDEMFPPDNNSIGDGLLSPGDMGRVVWLRPAV